MADTPLVSGTNGFVPHVLRSCATERQLLQAAAERVLAEHPAWPWPLIEAEARRRVAAILADQRVRGGAPVWMAGTSDGSS